MIDYKEIIDNLQDDSIIKLMTSLGANSYEEHTGHIIFPTICHNVDSDNASMKLYYYRNSKLFYCYTECGAMNIFKFLEHYYETRAIDYNWYSDILQVVLKCSTGSLGSVNYLINTYKSVADNYRQNKTPDFVVYDEHILDCFEHYYAPEWLEDNISTAAMDRFNIRYSITQNKIIIPHYDYENRLIGIRGRALNPWEVENIGKYMPVQIENKWYSHPLSLNLYGLNLNKNVIKENGVCYIFESEKSCLQFDNFNLPNCAVASCGSSLNKFQIKLLMKICQPTEIVVCYDREEKPYEDKYFYKLYNMCKKYTTYTNMSFIYDRNGISKMKDSPSDNGQEIFEKLLSERVRVK